MQLSLFENKSERRGTKSSSLFSQMLTFQNFHRSYIDARKCKRYRSSILKFGYNLEENICTLLEELRLKTYKHGGYREFIINDSKKRLIKAAPFRDRVVHHAICNIIEPIFDKGFVYDSYACRKGKGTHAAILRLEYFIKALWSGTPAMSCNARTNVAGGHERERERERERPARNTSQARFAMAGGESSDNHVSFRSTRPESSFLDSRHAYRQAGLRGNDNRIYCLKCDISKYFNNVNHEVLLGMLRRKIKDKDILWLLDEIIASNPSGIPIGNLTSQLFANVYLNELDHFVKRELKEKYYIRYMDDFLILGTDKKYLGEQKEKIRIFLKDKLKLNLHPKKAEIFPIRESATSNGASPIEKGLDFLGYVLVGGRRRLRKSTVKRFIKRKKRYAKLLRQGKMSEEFIRKSEQSWLGYARFGDSYWLRKKLGLG